MLYKTGAEWIKAENKRVSLFGMSGVGKTFLANTLRNSYNWFHYSIDYRIATKYLGEEIVDQYKKEAMKLPLLREHLLNDSMYIASNVTFSNLAPLSSFLGKPGRSDRGGITFNEYVKRQRKHHQAEVNATIDTKLFSQKAAEIYGYNHFIADTSGSLCEIVNPSDQNDKVLKSLGSSTLPIWIRGSNNLTDELYSRFKKSPKPMYYNENFLKETWTDFGLTTNQSEKNIDPNEFSLYGFKALIAHRLPIYEKIAQNWGITIETEKVQAIRTENDFVDLVSESIDKKVIP